MTSISGAQTDQWYMIQDDLVNRELLSQNGIVFAPIQVRIGKRDRERDVIFGISFPAGDLQRVLELLNLPALINKTPTSQRNVTLLEQPTITITENDIYQTEYIIPVLREFAYTRGKNLVVANPCGKAQKLPKRIDNTLYIYFWSVPTGYRNRTYPIVYDFELGRGQGFGTVPSGAGAQIIDEHGTVVAEVHEDRALYILFDLPERGINAAPILARILQEWDFLYVTPEERLAILAAREAELQRRSIDLYIAAIATRATAYKKALHDELVSVNARIDKERTELVELLRRQTFLVQQTRDKKTDTGDIEATIAAEFKQLEALPHVTKVRLQENLLLVYTDLLHSQELAGDGTIRELGEYIIRIGLDGQSLTVQNLTHMIDNRYHPHDMGGGTLCLGNFGAGIAQMVAQYQFYTLVMMMIHFLKNPNEHDLAGSQIYDWPVATVT